MNEQTALRLNHTVERLERQIAILSEAVGPLGDWITAEQAKRHFDLGPSRLHELARRRVIRKAKNGRHARWNRFDLERYVYGLPL